MGPDTQVYEPGREIKRGIGVWPAMFRELWDSRELAQRLFLRSLTSRYKQALLGFAWAMILPFVAIGTFVLLKKAGVVSIGETDIPYVLFALVGVTIFQLFATGLTSACNSLVEAGDMIGRVSFPREILVLSAAAQALFELLIKAALIAAVCVWYSYLPPLGALLMPLALLPLVFLMIGLGLVLSLANAIFRDTAHAVGLLMTFLLFLTPVLYPVEPGSQFVFLFNPLTALIDGPRDLFIYGTLRNPFDFLVASAVSVLVFFCAWRVFHLVETKIPERM